jgi:Tn3 transposase DDE domain
LARSEDFDYLDLVGEGYTHVGRYAPTFLAAFEFRAAPVAKSLNEAINLLRQLNVINSRRVPNDAPRAFVRQRWSRYVFTEDGIDRRYYELCVLAELKNALCSGDMWVDGSRQFRDFEDYLLSRDRFDAMLAAHELHLAIDTECKSYLAERLDRLHDTLTRVDALAAIGQLPDVEINSERLYVPGKPGQWPALAPLIGGSLNLKLIEQQFLELARLAASIKHGTVTASLILGKLGSYPRQNSLALALRELGRIERTLFTLEWLQNPELRRRVNAGLNKSEEKNALARAVFFNRLGELRDRTFEDQRYRASGLNLAVAAIVAWNTVYLECAVANLAEQKAEIQPELLAHLSPLGWEHIGLTGDYTWHENKRVALGRFRPLRLPSKTNLWS